MLAMQPEHRAMIGTVDLQPAWQLDYRVGPTAFDEWVDITEQLETATGPAILATQNLKTAPSGVLELTTLGDTLTTADPNERQYRLQAGYVFPDGVARGETVGYYFLDMETENSTERVTTLGSMELLIAGLINAPQSGVANKMRTAAMNAMDNPLPQTRATQYIQEVLLEAGPAPWKFSTPVAATPDYEPDSLEWFDYATGADVWNSISTIAQGIGYRIIPRNAGWGLVAIDRDFGVPAATIPRTHMTNVSTTWQPRAIPETYIVKYNIDDGAGGTFPRIAGALYGSFDVTLRRGRVESYGPTTTAGVAVPYAYGKRDALRSEEHQITFTAPAMPWLTSDDTIEIVTTDDAGSSSSELYMISTVQFDVIAGLMTVTARG